MTIRPNPPVVVKGLRGSLDRPLMGCSRSIRAVRVAVQERPVICAEQRGGTPCKATIADCAATAIIPIALLGASQARFDHADDRSVI